MRRNWIVTIILVLSVGIWARAENNNRASAVPPAPPKEAVKPADSSAAKNVETARTEKREASAVELELQQLRELLLNQAKELEAQREGMRQQQQKLEALTQELREVRASKEAAASSEKQGSTPVSLGAVSQNQEDLGNKVGKIEQEVSATKKSLETRIKGFGPFNFSGDLRLRYENAFGGRATNVPRRRRPAPRTISTTRGTARNWLGTTTSIRKVSPSPCTGTGRIPSCNTSALWPSSCLTCSQ